MSRVTTDGGLADLLRQNLGPGSEVQRIESTITGSGIPDTNIALDGGVERWVELKQTTGWTCPLRREQVGWLCRRAHLGCRVYVATRRRNDRGDDELWLHSGRWARELVTGGLEAAPVLVHEVGGPAQWRWTLVRQALGEGWT